MADQPERVIEPSEPPAKARIVMACVGPLGVFGAVLFVSAGRWDWLLAWLYLAVIGAGTAFSSAYLLRKTPEVIAYRSRFGAGTKTWDKIWMGVFAAVVLAAYVVAGLDAGRYGWSAMAPWLWPLGLALFAAGATLYTWSMGVNPFFEKTVRIQRERGQYVIDSGPYRHVRHPGYVGFFGWILSVPLLLGSWWAFGPAVLAALAVIVRTALEDRVLRAELPGYDAYARRVRFRLIPNIW